MTRASAALLVLLASPLTDAMAQSARPSAQINGAIIDLFLNYELTEKNGNSSTLIDYLPRQARSPLKRVEMTSNYGGEDEHTTFAYGDRGRLEHVTYQRGDKLYQYDLTYEQDRPASVAIAGMKRITFGYRGDTLVTITRERTGGILEYALDYPLGQNRADLKLTVVIDGKRKPSPSKYYATWDDRRRLTGYALGTYTGRDITYSDAGDVATFTHFTHDDQARTMKWDYVLDPKSSWTERRLEKLLVKRSIQYATP
jgi:hypothetical protein